MSDANFFSNQLKNLQIPTAILDEAACRGVDPKIMDGETLMDIRQAQAICAQCPVRARCEEWAVSHEPAGIWGGLTPRQRAVIRKGKKLVDVRELNEIVSKAANLFSGKTVKVLAFEYRVTERTIYRWRSIVNEFREAS